MADEKTGPVRLGVTEVARRLKLRYHKARDLMLTGKLGEATTQDGRHLTILESQFNAYVAKQAAEKKK